MKAFAKIIISVLIAINVSSLKSDDSNIIQFNTLFTASSFDNTMKFYSMDLDENTNDMDLLVDSRIINSHIIYESPIVLVSTVI